MTNQNAALDFAKALDNEDYEKASQYLDIDCIYEISPEVIKGRKAIINSYKEAGDWGKKNLDSLSYKSKVEKINDDVFLLTFNDFIKHKNLEFTYSSQQKVTFNKIGKIINIQNKVNPEKKKALEDFFNRVKVIR